MLALSSTWMMRLRQLVRASTSDRAEAHQIAQCTNRLLRHKAGRDQPVTQQVGDPLAVLHVSLAAGHILDALRVADHQCEVIFPEGINRTPIDPRALHPDMATALLRQPISQLQQPGCRRCAKLRISLRTLPPGFPASRQATMSPGAHQIHNISQSTFASPPP
jgi:hypothetical protein